MRHIHNDVILILDFLSQRFQLFQREHLQNAVDDSQSFDVVFFGVGFLLQIGSDGRKSLDDAGVHHRNGNGALEVSVHQTGLSGTIPIDN